MRIELPGYPDDPDSAHTEVLPAQPVGGELFGLQAHSLFLPLGPGDVVRAPSVNVVDSVNSVVDSWIIEVFMKLKYTNADTESLAAYWRRDVPVTVTSALSMRVTSATKEWVDANVVSNPMVSAIEVVRRPGQGVDLQDELDRQFGDPPLKEETPPTPSSPGSSDYPEINERASSLGRHLTILQMVGSHGVSALVLGAQAGIVARLATELETLLSEHPDAKVVMDARLNEGMESAYMEILVGDVEIPDTFPLDWPRDDE